VYLVLSTASIGHQVHQRSLG